MNKNISIQQLTGEVRRLIDPLDPAALRELILGLAQRQPVQGRADFLEELKIVLSGADKPEEVSTAKASDDALHTIETVLDEVMERQGLIENGDYHELDEWEDSDWNYYDDEGPDPVTDEHRTQLQQIREEADFAWLDGKCAHAVKLYRALSNNELVTQVYRNYPYYAINSRIAEKLMDTSELEEIARYRPVVEGMALCSIGYEGLTLEGYINRLIRHGVKIVCDVRKNALSRKFGFSKTILSRSLESMGIEYRHFPKLGIPSDTNQGEFDLFG